jgi:transcriptional regulator with XRE-family HTH domain
MREFLNFTQAELAESMGLSQPALAHIETDRFQHLGALPKPSHPAPISRIRAGLGGLDFSYTIWLIIPFFWLTLIAIPMGTRIQYVPIFINIIKMLSLLFRLLF